MTCIWCGRDNKMFVASCTCMWNNQVWCVVYLSVLDSLTELDGYWCLTLEVNQTIFCLTCLHHRRSSSGQILFKKYCWIVWHRQMMKHIPKFIPASEIRMRHLVVYNRENTCLWKSLFELHLLKHWHESAHVLHWPYNSCILFTAHLNCIQFQSSGHC
jgi:hypothetical protein